MIATYITQPLINSSHGIRYPRSIFLASKQFCAQLHPSSPCGCAEIDLVSLETSSGGVKNYSCKESAPPSKQAHDEIASPL